MQWRAWAAYKLTDRSATAQIKDAEKCGFAQVSMLVEDGHEKILLYKAIDQLGD